jgi:hypothetical protein
LLISRKITLTDVVSIVGFPDNHLIFFSDEWCLGDFEFDQKNYLIGSHLGAEHIMDGARMRDLQAKGFRIAALKTGLPHDLFRPTGLTDPLAPSNRLLTLPVSWKPPTTTPDFKGALTYGKAVVFGYLDFSLTQPGDYLVRQEDGTTFFMAAQQHLLQPMAVQCNGIISISRPGKATEGFGDIEGYSQAGQGTPVISGWPCAILQGTKGEKPDDGLPRDTRQPWVAITLPPIDGLDIRTADMLTDDRDRHFIVSSTERTDLGWRLTAAYEGV